MIYLRPLIQTGICSAFLGLLISCGGSSQSGATLQSIEINPSAASAAAGTTSQLTATGIYSDGGHRDVTYDATWSSSNSAVANVNAGGVASAAAQGTTTISAKLQGITGSGTLTVTAATLVSIEVTPALPSIAKGRTLQFVATGIFSDNSTQNLTGQVTWSSSNASLASISTASGSNGLATATGAGKATISAASGSITGSTSLTITGALLTAIEITPNAPSIAKGVSQPFVAMGIFSDNSTQNLTTQVTWASTSTAVAVVSNSAPTIGTVTATGIGTTTLSASTASLSASIQATVTPATLVSIQVTPPTPSVASGLSQQFTATGIYTDNSTQNLTTTATWATTTPSVATVSNAAGSQGLATSANPGSAGISASLGGVSNSATLAVTPATLVSIAVTPGNSTIPKGLTAQMAATGTYTDHSTQDLTTKVTFSSATPTVATISNAAGSQGLATSASVGSTIIAATLGAASGTTTLSIGAAALVSIQVTASGHSIAGVGLTQAFVATGTYTDASTQLLTTQATWSSSAPGVATISNAPGTQGVATSVAVGNTTITAASGTISGTSTLAVMPAILMSISISPANKLIFDTAGSLQMHATGHYNDGTAPDLTTSVTWTSSNTSVAVISNVAPKGLVTVTPTNDGNTTITAALGAISGSTPLTVTQTHLVSIAVTFFEPGNNDVLHTVTQEATATGTFDDGSSMELGAAQITWASSDPTVATVDSGVVTWTGLGTASIIATSSPISGSGSLTVTEPAVLHVSATSTTITGLDLTQQFLAKGDYTTSVAPLDLTNLADWSSSDHRVATVGNTAGNKGLARSVNTVDTVVVSIPVLVDSANITAMVGSRTDTQSLAVHQSFTQGNAATAIYDQLSAGQVTSSNVTLAACNSCHDSGGGAGSPFLFYVQNNSAATFTKLGSGSGNFNLLNLTNTGIYGAACVQNPGGGMPDYSDTNICHLLLDWIKEGATNP
jgi:hypothetical protein